MVAPSVSIHLGDLTTFMAHAIVNAANSNLDPGGGLDGAIRTAAGPLLNQEIADQRSRYGPLQNGSCIITRSYDITTARAIIHTAAPDLRLQQRTSDIASESSLFLCYFNVLMKADDFKLASIALPILGSGIYCYNMEQSLLVAIQAILSFVQYREPTHLNTFTIVILSPQEHQRALSFLGQSVFDASSPVAAWSSIEQRIFLLAHPLRKRKHRIPGTQLHADFTSFYDKMSSSGAVIMRNALSSNSVPPVRGISGVNHSSASTPTKRSIDTESVDQHHTPSKRIQNQVSTDTERALFRCDTPPIHRSPSPRLPSQGRGSRADLSPEELERVRQRGREKNAAYRARKKHSDGVARLANRSSERLEEVRSVDIATRREDMTPDQLEEARRKGRENFALFSERQQYRNQSSVPSSARRSLTALVEPVLITSSDGHLQQQPSSLFGTSNHDQSIVPPLARRSIAPLFVPVMQPQMPEHSIQPTALQRRLALVSQYDTAARIIVQQQPTDETSVPRVYQNLPEAHNLGCFDNVCPFCNGRNFRGVKRCCNNGKVWIDPQRELPQPIKRLLSDKHFLKNIVSYNTLLAMASLSYTKQPVGPMGVQAAKVLGQVTHWPSALFANQNGKECFGNYYVYDAKTATSIRTENDIAAGLDSNLLEQLHTCLIENHPFALSYQTMYRELRKEIAAGREPSRLKMRIVDRFEADKMAINLQQHAGTYSVPTGKDFVCVFFTCNVNQIVLPRGLTVYSTTGSRPQRELKSYLQMIDALCYPLIFPYGGGTWGPHRFPIERPPRLYQEKMDDLAQRSGQPDIVPEPNEEQQNIEEADNIELQDERDAEMLFPDVENDLTVDIAQNMEDNDEEFHMLNGQRSIGSRQRYIREERGGETYIRRGEIEDIPQVDGYMTDDSGEYDYNFDDDDAIEEAGDPPPDRDSVQNTEQVQPDEQARPVDDVFERLNDMQLLSQNVNSTVQNDDYNDMLAEDEIIVQQPLNIADEDITLYEPSTARQPRGFVSMRDAALFLNRYPFGEPSWIAQFRKLGQLHLIDVQTRIIHQRMEFVQKHFTQTMSTTKRKMLECLQQNLSRNGHNIKVGSVTTVPSHIPGTPRYMRNKFEDAVTLANFFGRPDLFITFTANIKWQEILDMLPSGVHGKDTFADHPHIVAEVFMKKLDMFLEDVVGKIDKHNNTRRIGGIFGEVIWFVYSVEFQQRGAPHVHLVISLKDHIETTQRIDEIVSARIPPLPATTDPNYEKVARLRELVIANMVHTPCQNDPTAYCQKDKPPHWKMCMKRFPKKFCTETSFGDQSYPDYFRPNDGEQCTKFVKRRPVICNNAYVVPYSPILLSKYGSHINVEVISSVKVVRYLFKYVFKGFDRNILEAFESFGEGNASSIVAGGKITQSGHILHAKKLSPTEIAERNRIAKDRLRDQGISRLDANRNPVLVYDETTFIEDLRAMTSCEAAWEIRGYDRCVSSNEVVTMHVHLEHEEPVQYVPGEEQTIIDRIQELGVHSRLNAWFAINQLQGEAGDIARGITFDCMPKFFVYKNKKWVLRERNRSHRVVGRLKPVQPRFLELFAIRLLCLNRRGITGFESLRTVDGVVFDTYVEAAKSLRLMNDEDEWSAALAEAATFSDPIALRRLFISILVFCSPKNARALWNNHKEILFENKPLWTIAQKTAHALFHIQSGLKSHELTLDMFQLPELIMNDLPPRDALSDDNGGAQHNAHDNTEIGQGMYQQLNPEQKTAVDAILNSSSQPADSNRLFFLEGAGGTGKTFIYTCLSHLIEGAGQKVLAVAHTGIAAALLRNGSTAHRAFCIPIEIDDSLTSKLSFESHAARQLADIDVIIWDESTMTDRRIYEAVDNLLRIIHNRPTLLMGGILTIFGGDWQQTLPIVDGIPEAAIPSYTLKATELWRSLTVLRLTTNQRAINDPAYAAFLMKVGSGQNDDIPNQTIRIPPDICMSNEDDVIQWLYGDDIRGNSNPRIAKSLLTVDNRTALALNERILCMLPGSMKTYYATDNSSSDTGFLALDSDAYRTMTPSGMPPFALNVKIGSHVILLRNQNVYLGLCNGSRLRVLEMGDDSLKCEPLTPGPFTPKVVVLHRMDLSPAQAPSREYAFVRHQFPIRLCYSMTINKSQGQTLDKVGIILRTPVFSHGQWYVAMSRVRSRNDIRIYNCRKNDNGTMSQFVKNVVLRRILS